MGNNNLPKLNSEKVIVQAPMSYIGSARRLWKITQQQQIALKILLIAIASVLIILAWILISFWYLLFGLLLVPYRLIRRGSRKNKKQELQHREQLNAISQIGRDSE